MRYDNLHIIYGMRLKSTGRTAYVGCTTDLRKRLVALKRHPILKRVWGLLECYIVGRRYSRRAGQILETQTINTLKKRFECPANFCPSATLGKNGRCQEWVIKSAKYRANKIFASPKTIRQTVARIRELSK